MRIIVNNVFFALAVVLVFSCMSNSAQSVKGFDKMPLDTTKWSVTETINIDFNIDGIEDVILFFDKYKALTRPNNVQTPVLFYLGTKTHIYSFIGKAEKIIYSPYYEIKTLNNSLIINQEGIEEDKNIYTNYYKFQNGEIIMYKEIVVQKIEKLKVDDKTGDVSVSSIKLDTIYNKANNIKIGNYDFMQFMQNFNK